MMKIESILQFRIMRFALYFAIACIVFSLSSEEFGRNIWAVLTIALVLTGVFSYISELSDAKGAVLFIEKSSADHFMEEMSLLGFTRLRSGGEHIYLRRGMDIIKLADAGRNYRVELPAVYELIAERYRSI